jgi:arylsulfatase A-like enzyme
VRLRTALLAAAAVAALGCGGGSRLPPTLVVEDVVRELGDVPFARADATVHPDRLLPGDPLRADGGRASVVMPPGSRAAWRIAVEPRTALRFGVGVEGADGRDRSAAGFRFTIAVDGARAYTRVVNPAARRRDRRWFDERVDLAPWAGRTVDVELAVVAEPAAGPVAGLAGWSRVRVVRETTMARAPAAPDRPNVLVLLVDTLRADAVGVYGARPSPTPTLDALAAQGTVFATAVGQSSWTLPSVASLLTGLPPRRHGAIGTREDVRGHVPDGRWGFLDDAALTWVKAAAHAGVTTFGVSANPLVSRGTNLAQGFETFVELPWDPRGRNWAGAAEVNAAFLAWLRANAGYRFVAYLHYMEPHDPYTPAERPRPPAGLRPSLLRGWIRDAATTINWGGGERLPPDHVAYLHALYRAEVRDWDRQLGTLLAGLDAAGVRGRTLVVVTADHGEEFQEHGRLTHGSLLYEESIRVPLVLVGPGVPTARRDDLAQGIDLFPTVAPVLGLEAAARDLPGRDLLAGPSSRPAVVETASGIAPDGAAIQLTAVRTERWKLIHAPSLARYELYDLAADPGEHDDRFAQAPEASELVRLLDGWRARTPAAAPAGDVDPAFAAKLQALGYVQ